MTMQFRKTYTGNRISYSAYDKVLSFRFENLAHKSFLVGTLLFREKKNLGEKR